MSATTTKTATTTTTTTGEALPVVVTPGMRFLGSGEATDAEIAQAIADAPSWLKIDRHTGSIKSKYNVFRARGSKGYVFVKKYLGLMVDLDGKLHLAFTCWDRRGRRRMTPSGVRTVKNFPLAARDLTPDERMSAQTAWACEEGEFFYADAKRGARLAAKMDKREALESGEDASGDAGTDALAFSVALVNGTDDTYRVMVDDSAGVSLGDVKVPGATRDAGRLQAWCDEANAKVSAILAASAI
jgi:hypothetical protein